MVLDRNMSLLDFIQNQEKDSINSLKLRKMININSHTSVHGMYPYRGKISSIYANSIISQFKSGLTLLDPFCGSGTIVYEAYSKGLNVIGIDNNPLAIFLSTGKMSLVGLNKSQTLKKAKDLVNLAKNLKNPPNLPQDCSKGFHIKSGEEIMRLAYYFNQMPDFIKSIFCGTICLIARGCNHYMWTSTTVGKNMDPKRYISVFEKFIQKVEKHFYPLNAIGSCNIFKYDSRNLDDLIRKKSINYVFTSPPYFDGLDYTSYYAKFIYSILNFDRKEIRKHLIQNVRTYEQDMKQVLTKLINVTKDDALIIFVVGDKKLPDNRIIKGGEFFSKIIHHKPAKILNSNYTSTPSRLIFDKLNRTQREEQIIIWDKSMW